MGKNAPTPTPPKDVSAALTGGNISTGIANAWLQNQNEVGPDGTKTFSQSGMQTVTDPYTGQTYEIPRFTTTTTLSPEQQAIKTQQDAAKLNMATSANGMTQNQQPFTLDNSAVEARLMDLGRQRLDPLMASQDEDLRTRLANQGIVAGSAAYDREMGLQGQNRNDAYNQLLLQGHQTATGDMMNQQQMQMAQLAQMLGKDVSLPNFQTGSGIGAINGTDNGAIIANDDAAKLKQWQEQQGATGSFLGGLGGLFSGGANSAMSGLMSLSDERVKHDKHKIGETKDGMGIYSFKYNGTDKTQIGLMAQEVAKRKPQAVRKTASGLMAVDYGKALK